MAKFLFPRTFRRATLGRRAVPEAGAVAGSAHGRSVVRGLALTLGLLAVLAGGGASARAAMSSTRIFERVSPSVVVIRDAEGFGSGIVIDKDGLILTNFHVVHSPLKKQVVATIRNRGKETKHTFKKVTLVGVHPRYDAALLRIEDVEKGMRFTPAKLDVSGTLPTGGRCYVIGHPAGGNMAMTHSISEGLISNAQRILEGLEYIQTSAPVNPGNSGGALISERGEVVGLVTFKFTDSEGIGFAIPVKNLDTKTFGAASARQDDMELCRQAEEIGAKFWQVSLRLREPEKSEAVAAALFFYKISSAAAPNASAPCNNLALCYKALGEVELAKAYYERCAELNPDSATAWQALGIMAQERGDMDEAKRLWELGVNSTIDKIGASMCADSLAIHSSNAQDPVAAAFYAQRAMHWHPRPERTRIMKQISAESQPKLQSAQRAYLATKRTDWSAADLERFRSFAKGQPWVGQGPKPEAEGVADLVAAAKTVEIKAAEGLTIPLPGTPKDVRLACGGAYMVVGYENRRGLDVIDLAREKIVETIKVSDDLFATTGGRLYTYHSASRRITEWNLLTMEKMRSTSLREIGTILRMGAGLDYSPQAVIFYEKKGGEKKELGCGFINLRRLAFEEMTMQPGGSIPFLAGDRFDLAVGPRCRAFALWGMTMVPGLRPATHSLPPAIGAPPRGVPRPVPFTTIATIHSQVTAINGQPVDIGSVSIGQEAQMYCGAKGVLWELFKRVHEIRGAQAFATVGSPYVMLISKGKQFSLHKPWSQGEPLLVQDLPKAADLQERPGDVLPASRRIWPIVRTQKLAVVSRAEPEVRVYQLPVSWNEGP